MSAPKWTAGPWRVFGKDTGIVGRYEQDDHGSVEVCRVGAFADKDLLPFNRVRWAADAHLIAAAPEMYEALERIRYECDNDLSGLAKLFIDATLAKARGES